MRMIKRIWIWLIFGALIFGFTGLSYAREDPEITKAREQIKAERKAKAEAERKARREDPNRRLRPYQTLDEIYAELDELLAEHPDLMSGGVYGKSVQGRDLRWVKFTGKSGDKPEVTYSANIHAMELASGQCCMGVIRYLADGYGKEVYATYLVDHADIYAVPIMNPDGVAKFTNQQARRGLAGMVRKNANRVDLNRNYPYPSDAPSRLKDWAGSKRKWMPTYQGPEPLSEPESLAFLSYIEAHDFILHVNWHTSGGMIMFPPATFPDPIPDGELLKEMGQEYQDWMFDKYRVHSEFALYPTIGSLDDYLYHRYGVLCITMEVGKARQTNPFIPHHGTFSPIMWMSNVWELDREIANNLWSALHLTEWAIRIHENPEMYKWQASDELWVGEPAK